MTDWRGIPLEYQNQIVTGDARNLARAIPDGSVDLVLTDPPFGIGHEYSGYDDDPAGYISLISWVISESQRVIKPNGFVFIFSSMSRLSEVWPLAPKSRLFFAGRNFVQMGRPDEPFYFGVPYAFDPVIFWRNGATQKTAGRDWHIGNTANTNNRGLADAKFHSCPRPLDTIMYMVDNFSATGGIVCDFFAGSGTTPLACKLTARNYVAFEIDSATADAARLRVQQTQPPLPLVMPEQLEMAL